MTKTTIIMSSYNGEKYIREQIESILKQDQENLILYIRDDGSTDTTVEIIKEYIKTGRVFIDVGINLGAKASFMKAIQDAPEADFYALSDQDDIWEYNKVSIAINKIKKYEDDVSPILYHSALNLSDKDGNVYATTGTYNNIGFLNGENRAITGCTVVFNSILMDLLRMHIPKSYSMHDSWIHNLCLAVGGKVIYDEKSYIKYRQHDNNVVGGSKGLLGAVKRRYKYLKNMEKCQISNMYKEIIDNYGELMPEKNYKRAKRLCEYNSSFLNKIYVLFKGHYFKGRLWWRFERYYLILSNRF